MERGGRRRRGRGSRTRPAPGRRSGRDRQHDRSWRGRVDVEGARDDHRAAGAAEPELHPVEPVRGAHAGVGAAVPDHPHRRPGPRVDAIGDPPHAIAVAVDDGDGHLPGLLDLEGDPLDVAPAVAVGGEEARDARDLRHRVGALEALGDEERAEGRRHEQREDDTGEPGQRAGGPAQGALSLPTTTATDARSPASACVSASIARRSEMLSARLMSRAWRRALRR